MTQSGPVLSENTMSMAAGCDGPDRSCALHMAREDINFPLCPMRSCLRLITGITLLLSGRYTHPPGQPSISGSDRGTE